MPAFNLFASLYLKRARDVGSTLRAGQSGLRSSPFSLAYGLTDRQSRSLAEFARQQLRLIETAAPSPDPVERHRYDEVETLRPRQRPPEKRRERPCQRGDSTVLVQVNEFSQRTRVLAIRVHTVETRQPAPAKLAAAILVERRRVQKRGAALDAEELGDERLRAVQTVGANRDS